MLKHSKVLLPIVVTLLLWSSCDKDGSAPSVPEITFKSAEFVDKDGMVNPDSLTVTFGFIDGDGDIGSNTGQGNDSCYLSPTPDVEVDYYELVEGQWVLPEEQSNRWCLANITPTGQDKYLEGDIAVTMGRNFNSGSESNDSVKLSILLRDRAGNVSNIIESQLITEL